MKYNWEKYTLQIQKTLQWLGLEATFLKLPHLLCLQIYEEGIQPEKLEKWLLYIHQKLWLLTYLSRRHLTTAEKLKRSWRESLATFQLSGISDSEEAKLMKASSKILFCWSLWLARLQYIYRNPNIKDYFLYDTVPM